MKYPIWIANLGLLSLALCSFLFIYFSRTKPFKRESIEPSQTITKKDLKVAINIKKIYEHDLFNTYVKEVEKPQNIPLVAPFPMPPIQQKIIAPKIIEPEFLDPLQITLIGIIVIGSNDLKNRAIIQEDKTKQENTYQVGDIIQDAQLIRIFKNKVILLRLNGQQEVLYLREQDAKSDASYNTANEWDKIIKKVENNTYLINPKLFITQVENLTQFIDMLNCTTAYQKGKSIGLQIGQTHPQSLATLLGLQKGDIITSINNIPTQTVQERLAIYKNIITLTLNHSITVDLLRNNKKITLEYTLVDSINDEDIIVEPLAKDKVSFLSTKQTTQNEQQHYAFMPTINKLRKKDHATIVENGKYLLDINS